MQPLAAVAAPGERALPPTPRPACEPIQPTSPEKARVPRDSEHRSRIRRWRRCDPVPKSHLAGRRLGARARHGRGGGDEHAGAVTATAREQDLAGGRRGGRVVVARARRGSKRGVRRSGPPPKERGARPAAGLHRHTPYHHPPHSYTGRSRQPPRRVVVWRRRELARPASTTTTPNTPPSARARAPPPHVSRFPGRGAKLTLSSSPHDLATLPLHANKVTLAQPRHSPRRPRPIPLDRKGSLGPG